MRIAPLMLFAVCGGAACGGTKPVRNVIDADVPARAADPFLVEHDRWEDVEDQRLVFSDKCGRGPFQVAIPVRADDDARFEYGRRMVLQVYGPRTMSFNTKIDTTAGLQTGIHVSGKEVDAAHVECRAGDGVPIGTMPATVRGVPAKPASGTSTTTKAETPYREKNWYLALDTPSEKLPQLVPFTSKELGTKQQVGAIAMLPKGEPFYYADDHGTHRIVAKAGPGIKLRFWFPKPSNLEGVVFRIVEQRLAPLPNPRYAEEFAARVEAVKQRHLEERPELERRNVAYSRYCKAHVEDYERCGGGPLVMSLPPPPLDEKQPKAPKGEVAWIPGYWSWDVGLDDFVWIAGTYVIRPKPVPVAAVVAVPSAPAPKVAPPPVEPKREPPRSVVEAPRVVVEPIAPVRELDIEIEAPPPPKPEVITPPTVVVIEQPNGVWIPGHWELTRRTWRWIGGGWTNAPAGMRFRAPVVRLRRNVRVYVPGGWVRI